MSETTISYDFQALAIAAAKLRGRIVADDADKAAAARTCSTLDEIAAWAEDDAERRR